MTRILLADDHAVTRNGFRHFLQGEFGCEIGEAASATALLEQLRAETWDLLLLDMQLPDRTGLTLLREIREEFPTLRVLVVSALPEELYAKEVLRAGAQGYLSKASAANELIVAVRKLLNGQRYLSAQVAEQMVNDLGKPDKPPYERLSGRERHVFDRLAAGATVSGVAAELKLSVKTISTYRARIMEKMGIGSNADMTSYAMRVGLIS
jgi:two-component system invasion response regulator UvrY